MLMAYTVAVEDNSEPSNIPNAVVDLLYNTKADFLL
jgi:hypothetical protein